MKKLKSILLTEQDVENYKPVIGSQIDVILVPESCRDTFFKSKAFMALWPCVCNSPDKHVLFYQNFQKQ